VADETRMETPSLFTTMYTYVAPQDAVTTPMLRIAAIGHFTKHSGGASGSPGALCLPLFTRVRGRGILGTSPFLHSANFAITQF
jgi:hypothetical protein